MGKEVIIACDFASEQQLMDFLEQLGEARPYLKIGMELYYALGADIVKKLKARGHKLFLDLKLHDIPNTVKKSMTVLAQLGVDMVNLHAAGGSEMMKAAMEGLAVVGEKRPLLIAVTQLTSTSQAMLEQELMIDAPMDEVVIHYAQHAKAAGLAGVVCSPLEAAKIHREIGSEFLTVTPGIRFAHGSTDDQVRVMTPAKAKLEGADYIVVGRSITAAKDVLAAYQQCVADFVG